LRNIQGVEKCRESFKEIDQLNEEENDEYLCDYGRTLIFLYEQYRKSDNGYKSLIRIYECLDCSGCPHRDRCVKSEKPLANRRIYINRKLNAYKEQAKKNLCSEEACE